MSEINYQFSRHNAKNAQHLQFSKNELIAIPQAMATKYGFINPWNAYNQAVQNQSNCYKPEQSYLDTPEVETTDRARDEVFLFYSRVIQDYADYCPDAEKKKAAQTLAHAFRETGDATRMEYSGETAAIDDLVEKLQEEPYASALTVMGMEDAPETLSTYNTKFNEIFMKRTDEERKRAYASNMKTLRPITDEAFNSLARTINALYAVNELTTQDETTRQELGKIIDDANSAIVRFRKTIGNSSSSGGDEPEPTPEPEPVTPEITAVYQKEGGDPENPNRIERGKQTGVKYQGFTLKGQNGTLEHVIGLVNDQDYIEWINPETITNVTETSCEFTMVPDLTEGQYKVRIETYDGGSPLVVEYSEPITLW